MAPVTLKGRIVAGVWMVITLIFATSMVAGIASTLTLTGMDTSIIEKAEELAGKKVATLNDSPTVEFLKKHRAKIVETTSVNDAFSLLREKK